jgi:hypothetical protein
VGEDDINAQIDQIAVNTVIAHAAWEWLTQSPIGGAFTTASTLLGVARLGFPGPTRRSRPHRSAADMTSRDTAGHPVMPLRRPQLGQVTTCPSSESGA